ncbi:uncharacterized protein LOC124889631 [Capsicum annuum]|uniref:uncharacterized protein LOC124889631 n=1 Tax=Capsicum annuum TaxID=4072 RepID=UPI001FB1237C|nr:uncharacterized protein LOC124889631 [Capsicum annuum]
MENSDWCKQIKSHLGVLDLDVALYSEKPTAITKASSGEENSYYKHWDRSNKLGLMFMRMNIAGNIKTTLPKTKNAKEFLKLVEESFQTADKSLVGTLMGTLTTMKFDGSRTMHEHVIEMTNIAARLKSLGMKVEQNFLVQFIINSLPSEYGPFQMNYNTMKDKWNMHELNERLPETKAWFEKKGISYNPNHKQE